VINTLLAMYAQGLAEAVRFAERNGVKIEDLITLVNNSALGSPFIKIKGEAILRENFQAAFALKHIAKDLRLANDKGLTTPMTQLTFQTFQGAAPTLGEEDIIAIIKQFS
jgi:3-hydroxyisobutyrate dehydrogenase